MASQSSLGARDEGLSVRPDPERGFAIEGEFSWLVGAGAASPEARSG